MLKGAVVRSSSGWRQYMWSDGGERRRGMCAAAEELEGKREKVEGGSKEKECGGGGPEGSPQKHHGTSLQCAKRKRQSNQWQERFELGSQTEVEGEWVGGREAGWVGRRKKGKEGR